MPARILPWIAMTVSLAVGPTFEPIQPELLSGGGAFVNAFADYDRDGDLDLFVGFNGAASRLYRNDGDTLTDTAAAVGLADARPTRAAAWGDYDGDGDPDLLVGFAPGQGSVLRLYRNEGKGFVDATAGAGLSVSGGAVRQPAWIDVDADGDLDLFVAFRDRADTLFLNEGDGFTDVAAAVGLADARRTVGAVWFDYDEDGDLDLYAGHMDGDANGLYRNDRGSARPGSSRSEGWRFTDVAEVLGMAWGGRAPREATNGTVRPCAADVNGDGRFDLFTANYGPNGLFLNRGSGRFEDVSAVWGIPADTAARHDTCVLSDFDNDGRLDLYVNGTVTGGVSYRDYLFRNTGAAFEDVTPDNIRALHADHGAAWADVDGDGDEDLALTGSRPDVMPLLFRNRLPDANARRGLHIRVVDARGRATLAGAEVRVYARGTRRLLGARLVDSGSGYNAQNDMPVHVAVPPKTRVDIEVTYPAAGRPRKTWMRNVDPQAAPRRTVTVRALVEQLRQSPARGRATRDLS